MDRVGVGARVDAPRERLGQARPPGPWVSPEQPPPGPRGAHLHRQPPVPWGRCSGPPTGSSSAPRRLREVRGRPSPVNPRSPAVVKVIESAPGPLLARRPPRPRSASRRGPSTGTCRSAAASGSVPMTVSPVDERRALEDLHDRVEARTAGVVVVVVVVTAAGTASRRHAVVVGAEGDSTPPIRRPPGRPAPHDAGPAHRDHRRGPAAEPGRRPAKPAGRLGKTATVALLRTGADRQPPVALGRARHHERLGLRRPALRERAVEARPRSTGPCARRAPSSGAARPPRGTALGRHLDVVPVGRRVGDAEVDARPGEAGGGGEAGVQAGVLAGDDAAHRAVVDGQALRAERRRRQQGRRAPARSHPSASPFPSAGPWRDGRARARAREASVAPPARPATSRVTGAGAAPPAASRRRAHGVPGVLLPEPAAPGRSALRVCPPPRGRGRPSAAPAAGAGPARPPPTSVNGSTASRA